MKLQGALVPLQVPYLLALGAKNLLYAGGRLRQRELRRPVVSVGNLSVGGAGKTPVVLALLRLLGQHGVHADVLSRGYGRQSAVAVEWVDPAMRDGAVRRFGDEPLLLARSTGAPVFVGADRFAAGLLAERDASGAGVHLLDDGFQHRALARAVDVVVVHPRDIHDRLLPAGRLREPLRALGRADILVLREEDEATEAALHRAGIRKPVWRVRRSVAVPLVPGEAVAFCGIAHPEEFFASLRAHGVVLRDAVAFRDHHRFTSNEIYALAARVRGAAALLTTEKDFQRLSEADRARLGAAAPLHTVPLRAEFTDENRCAAELFALLRAWQPMRE